MLRKLAYSLGLFMLVSVIPAGASAVLQSTPAELAKKQVKLSQDLVSSYSKHKDITRALERLEEQQNRLKDSIHDPEINNLLDFLQICLRNIKVINKKPHSNNNKELIADLGASIGEGNSYIAQELR